MKLMTRRKTYRIIAIVSYLLIMLAGQIIALPFFFWLTLTLFDFGSIDQLFAVLAVAGLAANWVNRDKKATSKLLTIDAFCFFLLASPLVRRMTAAPLELFNYWAFIIPTSLFVLSYFASLFFAYKQYSEAKSNTA